MKNKQLSFLERADKIASSSKDQSTKVGAFFVDEDEISLLGFGYNGMPRGMPDSDAEKNKRPEKYLWYEHAERNAIYNAAQPLMENAMIFCSHFPNMESARAIVSVGIQKVIVSDIEKIENYEKVLELFELTKVQLIRIQEDKKINKKLLEKYQFYLDLATEHGEDLSNDFADNKSGVIILNQKTFSPIAMGVSGPPPFMEINDKKIHEDGKSFWIQEAEKNAIFTAIRPKLKKSHAYVSWCPCAHCALALASVGVNKVITKKPDFTKEADKRWKEHFDRTEKIFQEMNIGFELIDENDLNNNKRKKIKIS
jgi:dCMP deaminase